MYSKLTFSSWPESILVAGVNIGSGSFWYLNMLSGNFMPQISLEPLSYSAAREPQTKPLTTHSKSMRLSIFWMTMLESGLSISALGTISSVFLNAHWLIRFRTSPLNGMHLGRTMSKAETLSEDTMIIGLPILSLVKWMSLTLPCL